MESAATDEGEARGTHVKRKGVGAGVVKTMSMSERGMESAATDEGEARGTHVKRKGVGAGVVKTMAMSERGEMAAGKPKTRRNASTLLVLYHDEKLRRPTRSCCWTCGFWTSGFCQPHAFGNWHNISSTRSRGKLSTFGQCRVIGQCPTCGIIVIVYVVVSSCVRLLNCFSAIVDV